MMWSLTLAKDCRKVSKGERNDGRKGRREEEGLFVGREIRDGYDCGMERREGLMTMGGEVREGMTVGREEGKWLCEGKWENDCVKGNERMTV